MDKYPLIGVSICAVVLLVLASLTNVVGYQAVQSSNQNIINEEVDQKELLFQTIVDFANNKEIQQVIIKSQITKGGFINPDVKVPIFNTPLITKSQLKQMYVIGLMLSKTISKAKMHSLIEKYSVNNQVMQKEITAVIEKDTILNGKITHLSDSNCNCENKNTLRWNFPILCALLSPLIAVAFILYFFLYLTFLLDILAVIDSILNCGW